jgi:G3E family GTPase
VLEGGDQITVLSNGCLCCTVRDDLVAALNNLYNRRSEFDHIVIETTGAARPRSCRAVVPPLMPPHCWRAAVWLRQTCKCGSHSTLWNAAHRTAL